jgi:hypothetical protein
MILHLTNREGQSIQITNAQWRISLELALKYGWKPMGTKPNEEHLRKRFKNPEGGFYDEEIKQAASNWSGTYYTNEGQITTYADALNLSFALEEAQKDGHKKLKELIAFCKMGGFNIS